MSPEALSAILQFFLGKEEIGVRGEEEKRKTAGVQALTLRRHAGEARVRRRKRRWGNFFFERERLGNFGHDDSRTNRGRFGNTV